MTLIPGKLRGRRFLAWIHHRRWWRFSHAVQPVDGTRVTDDKQIRLTDDGFERVID